MSSDLEQQRREHELFMLKEDQRLEREMEEMERYSLHMEMVERLRQAPYFESLIESDQATMSSLMSMITA